MFKQPPPFNLSLLLLLCLAFVLSSCQQADAPAATPSPIAEVTDTALVPVWPTVAPDAAAATIHALFTQGQTPACTLPCWWGVVPWQTHWPEVQPYFDSLATTIYTYPHYFMHELIFPIPTSLHESGEVELVYSYNVENKITMIDIPPLTLEGYAAPTVLRQYGVPDEVWVQAAAATTDGVSPLQLLLVYQQQGMSFLYEVNGTQTGEMVRGCFDAAAPISPMMRLWGPDRPKPLYQTAAVSLQGYRALDEATDLTPATLHGVLADAAASPCLEVDATLWGE